MSFPLRQQSQSQPLPSPLKYTHHCLCRVRILGFWMSILEVLWSVNMGRGWKSCPWMPYKPISSKGRTWTSPCGFSFPYPPGDTKFPFGTRVWQVRLSSSQSLCLIPRMLGTLSLSTCPITLPRGFRWVSFDFKGDEIGSIVWTTIGVNGKVLVDGVRISRLNTFFPTPEPTPTPTTQNVGIGQELAIDSSDPSLVFRLGLWHTISDSQATGGSYLLGNSDSSAVSVSFTLPIPAGRYQLSSNFLFFPGNAPLVQVRSNSLKLVLLCAQFLFLFFVVIPQIRVNSDETTLDLSAFASSRSVVVGVYDFDTSQEKLVTFFATGRANGNVIVDSISVRRLAPPEQVTTSSSGVPPTPVFLSLIGGLIFGMTDNNNGIWVITVITIWGIVCFVALTVLWVRNEPTLRRTRARKTPPRVSPHRCSSSGTDCCAHSRAIRSRGGD